MAAAQNMMVGLENLSQRDQHQVMAQLNDMQMAESMNTYNNLVLDHIQRQKGHYKDTE